MKGEMITNLQANSNINSLVVENVNYQIKKNINWTNDMDDFFELS